MCKSDKKLMIEIIYNEFCRENSSWKEKKNLAEIKNIQKSNSIMEVGHCQAYAANEKDRKSPHGW